MEKISTMTMIEFYEKYWTVNGKPVEPLPEKERKIWEASEKLSVGPYIRIWKRRRGWVYEVHSEIIEALKSQQ